MLRYVSFCFVLMLLPATVNAEDVEFATPDGSVPHLRVELHWGRIEISTHGEDFARVQARGESSIDGLRALNEPRLEIEAADGRIAVAQPKPERGNFRSAIIQVTVPERCDLELVMLRGGDIEVRKVEGEISITNLNGSVLLENVAGAALVNASNGTIQASFGAVDEDLDLQFVTLNGSVELCLPETFQAQIALFTEGDPILSDFEVGPHSGGVPEGFLPAERGREAVFGQIGASRRWLVASTLNGEIRVEKCMSSE